MVLLDHITRGRIMFGVGPGALPSDAFMMGINPADQRDRMEQSLEAILALLDGSELVTRRPTGSPSATPGSSSAPTPTPASRWPWPPRSPPPVPGPPGGSACPCFLSGPPPPGLRHPGIALGTMEERADDSAPPSTGPRGAWSAPCISPRPRLTPARTSPSAWPSGSTTRAGRRSSSGSQHP